MQPLSCPHCDHDLYSTGYCPGCGALLPEPDEIPRMDDAPECFCPICLGDPGSDPLFRALFESGDDYYDDCVYYYGRGSLPSHSGQAASKVPTFGPAIPDPLSHFQKISHVSDAESKYLAFDIEIAKDLGDRISEWRRYRPLGITYAATLTSEGNLTLWHGRTAAGDLAGQMSPAEASELVRFLENQVAGGKTLLTWNGLGFDLNVLAEESGLLENCRELALHHVDMMFHIFCLKGYGLALDKAARGMGLPGKPAGLSGEMAPSLWKQGEYQLVFHYVSQDVRMTLDLAEIVQQARQLCWISNRGNS